MLDFDNALDRAGVQHLVVSDLPAPTITEIVTVTPASDQAGYKTLPSSEWGWSDLRDYIAREVEARHGPQVRDPLKESGICKAFMSRWGADQAVAIARAAFEVHDGWWRNAPITINRFTIKSDPYFSTIIASSL